MTTDKIERDDVVVAERPEPGTPRPYDFPAVASDGLGNGLTVLVADLPGRPLVSASLILPVGAVDEPADEGGAAVLAARALTEGTERFDAVGLTEASERLGASIHADAGWDAMSVSIDVPAANVAVVLSGSGSVREHVQRLGRILRRAKDKQAILYEVVAEETGEVFTSSRRTQHSAYQ